MNWFRWYSGAATDPKFQVVARRVGQSVASVVAVWAMLLERASTSSDRGAVDGFDCEGADAVLGLEDGAACAIVGALRDKGLLLGERIAKWEERQPKREDAGATERKRKQRERERQREEAARRAAGHPPSQDVTRCHAVTSPVTPPVTGGHDRVEKIREENKNTTPQGSTVNEGRARARVDVPEGGDGLCPEPHEAEEVAACAMPAAPVASEVAEAHERPEPECESRAIEALDGALDVSMEFVELRELYDRLARCEAPLAGHDAYKMLRAGRMWPGLARITQAIEEWGETPRWKRGYAPGLKRFLAERWWLKSPEAHDMQGAASDAGREPDTYSRLLEEARKQKEVRV